MHRPNVRAATTTVLAQEEDETYQYDQTRIVDVSKQCHNHLHPPSLPVQGASG
jgi:hypothetical protein